MASERMFERVSAEKGIAEHSGAAYRPAPLGWRPDPALHAIYRAHVDALDAILLRMADEGRRYPDRLVEADVAAARAAFWAARNDLDG